MLLQDLLLQSATKTPTAPAIRVSGTEASYQQVDALANQIGRALLQMGVQRGDRVGLWLEKSVPVVAAMQGVLRIGAAYVPIDPSSPLKRAHTILQDGQMRALVTNRERALAVRTDELAQLPCLLTDGTSLDGLDLQTQSTEALPPFPAEEHELAYILYTSGSTGKPKGVCISHLNALAFIQWSVAEIRATAADRFSSHAPFHFDLSVLDLYAAFQVGACVSIVPEGMSYLPQRLVEFLVQEQISVWYSVPSALILMMDRGGLLDVSPLPTRCLIFAGEPFPLKYVRQLRQRWPQLRLLNLYGPTETNVCTYHEVFEIEEDRTKPVPIGKASCGDRVWAEKDDGTEAAIGEEGELVVSGPTVMLGYWGRPPQGDAPYRTGDIVRRMDQDNFDYLGRRDNMVKVRGHRVELGEIEAALLSHPAIREAAVVTSGSGLETRLVAFLVSQAEQRLSLLALKAHCATRVPRSMIIEEARWIASLPRTGNGKVDRTALTQTANSPRTEGT